MPCRDRASVLLVVALMLKAVRSGGSEDDSSMETLNNPFEASTIQLENSYAIFFQSLTDLVKQVEITERTRVKLCGVGLPDYAKYQMTLGINTHHLLLATIESGLVPGIRQPVSGVWKLMRESHGDLPIAVDDWRERMGQFREMGEDLNVETPPAEEWIEAAKFIPPPFRTS